MGKACSMSNGEEWRACRILMGSRSKETTRNKMEWYGLDSSGFGWGSVEGRCERSMNH
jgi:hypothetical protein